MRTEYSGNFPVKEKRSYLSHTAVHAENQNPDPANKLIAVQYF